MPPDAGRALWLFLRAPLCSAHASDPRRLVPPGIENWRAQPSKAERSKEPDAGWIFVH
jgi:hypothetical protein